MNISDNIRRLRIKQNRSQQEIADLLDVERKTYAIWETNQTSIKADYIPNLAKIFNVEIADLFYTNEKISVNQLHNEGKDNSILNGAVLIITESESIKEILDLIKSKYQ